MRPAPYLLPVRHALLFGVLVSMICVTAGGCDSPTASRGAPFQPLTLRSEPDTVAPGDTFFVVFTLRNPSRDTQTVRSAMGCLYFLESLVGEQTVFLRYIMYYCTAMPLTFQIPPRDSLQQIHRLVAEVQNPEPPYDWGPAPSGIYRIRTRMNADLPNVETSVTVMDSHGAP